MRAAHDKQWEVMGLAYPGPGSEPPLPVPASEETSGGRALAWRVQDPRGAAHAVLGECKVTRTPQERCVRIWDDQGHKRWSCTCNRHQIGRLCWHVLHVLKNGRPDIPPADLVDPCLAKSTAIRLHATINDVPHIRTGPSAAAVPAMLVAADIPRDLWRAVMPPPLSKCRQPHRARMRRFIKGQQRKQRGRQLAAAVGLASEKPKPQQERQCGRCGLRTSTHTAKTCHRALGVLAESYHAEMAAAASAPGVGLQPRLGEESRPAKKPRQAHGNTGTAARLQGKPGAQTLHVTAVVGTCTSGHKLQSGTRHDAFVWSPRVGRRWASRCASCSEAVARADVEACMLCQEVFCGKCSEKVGTRQRQQQEVERRADQMLYTKAVAGQQQQQQSCQPTAGTSMAAGALRVVSPGTLAGHLAHSLVAAPWVADPWKASADGALARDDGEISGGPRRNASSSVGNTATLEVGVYVRFGAAYWDDLICTGLVTRKLTAAPRGQPLDLTFWEVKFKDGLWFLPERDIRSLGVLLQEAEIADVRPSKAG